MIFDQEEFFQMLFNREKMFDLVFPTTLKAFDARFQEILEIGKKTGIDVKHFVAAYELIRKYEQNHYYFSDYEVATIDGRKLSELAMNKSTNQTHRNCSVCHGDGFTKRNGFKLKKCNCCQGSKKSMDPISKVIVACTACQGKGFYRSKTPTQFYYACYMCFVEEQLKRTEKASS